MVGIGLPPGSWVVPSAFIRTGLLAIRGSVPVACGYIPSAHPCPKKNSSFSRSNQIVSSLLYISCILRTDTFKKDASAINSKCHSLALLGFTQCMLLPAVAGIQVGSQPVGASTNVRTSPSYIGPLGILYLDGSIGFISILGGNNPSLLTYPIDPSTALDISPPTNHSISPRTSAPEIDPALLIAPNIPSIALVHTFAHLLIPVPEYI